MGRRGAMAPGKHLPFAAPFTILDLCQQVGIASRIAFFIALGAYLVAAAITQNVL